MSYKHLSLEERHYIEIEMRAGKSLNMIAKALRRSQSTLSREISRNTGQRGYRHKQAERLASERHENKPKAVKLTDEIKKIITGYLEQDWSPEQIAGSLKVDLITHDIQPRIQKLDYNHMVPDKHRFSTPCVWYRDVPPFSMILSH